MVRNPHAPAGAIKTKISTRKKAEALQATDVARQRATGPKTQNRTKKAEKE